ncbi:RagB/SusD family nutrient uptake outer membrane protein [Pedobacter sp. HMF7647]|uniref:RagB/SusD family nutrient uptake outer membrane protein n=1 Tax=Hufsiella arboris TaxID=2695275 RepID=A0A7K1YD29_9SPHI|nr:RagB/SusD family nutrient uptake outer membrane protein [Hufsiella arboris]MXV52475.1 RagB/SusD family nutrient uptake outer membrane protein [Hufsiella arboris]
MKSRYNKIAGILLFFATMLSASCSSFLEEQDPSSLSPDSYFTLPEHATAGIAAAYDRTRFIGGGAGIFSVNWSMPEMVTGTASTETGQNTDLNNLQSLVYNGDNVHVNNWWNGLYVVIAQTNLVLDKVPGINPMEDATKKSILGEAYFLRAWSYFYLVRLFGDVPLIIKPVDASSPELKPTRTAVKDVYTQIVNDLKTAEASGLPFTDASGRASLGAVKTLLAKVYITMAGNPLNLGQEYYKLAADKAKEVIDNGGYSLFANYNDLHSVSTENVGEHIFELQFLASVDDNSLQDILLPNFKEISAYSTEIGSTVPTESFVKSFEAGDKRVQEQQFFYTSYYTGGIGPLKPLNKPYIFKHFDVLANGTFNTVGTTRSDLNIPNLLYSDLLLTYAEAQNETDGSPNAVAYKAINDIRTRATLPTLSGLSQAAFREAVWRERWHELCYDNLTWFDMVRLRKVYNEATNGFDDFVGHAFSYGPVLAQKHLLFPMPTNELKNNPNLGPQNPGY